MSTIDPNYELPPPDTVEVECEVLDVTGKIQSPTVTQIQQSISNHVNNILVHRDCKIVMLTTDGVATSYPVPHDLGTTNFQVTFFDVTSLPQRPFFVHWEPVTENVFRIGPDVVLPANRTIKVIIQ
jgi:hypothetical protein